MFQKQGGSYLTSLSFTGWDQLSPHGYKAHLKLFGLLNSGPETGSKSGCEAALFDAREGHWMVQQRSGQRSAPRVDKVPFGHAKCVKEMKGGASFFAESKTNSSNCTNVAVLDTGRRPGRPDHANLTPPSNSFRLQPRLAASSAPRCAARLAPDYDSFSFCPTSTFSSPELPSGTGGYSFPGGTAKGVNGCTRGDGKNLAGQICPLSD